MAQGPGRYDDITTEIRERLNAEGVILIVFGGNRGHGFEAQLSPEETARIPAILREVAKQLEGGNG